LPYLGKEGPVSYEIRGMIDQWIARACRAINAGAATYEDFLNMLPTDFAQKVNAAVIRRLS